MLSEGGEEERARTLQQIHHVLNQPKLQIGLYVKLNVI
jgi:hypothetical protein